MKIAAPRATLTTEATERLLAAAAERARALDIRVHIAIADAGAELVGFLGFEGAPRIAARTARHKAFTAVQTGMSTADWKAYTDSIPPDEQKIIDGIEGFIAAAGGLPILDGGLVLGGIGISGADQERDADVAGFAVAALRMEA